MDILSYKYGSILGGILFFVGLLGTSFAHEMWQFLVMFSVIAGNMFLKIIMRYVYVVNLLLTQYYNNTFMI